MSARDIIATAVRSAVLRHAPLPREVITLDMGELGEVLATVEYEDTPSDVDGSGRRDPAYLTLYSVTVDLLGDVLPYIKSLHPDALEGVVARVEEKLRREA